jgi:exonuclease III
LTALVTTPRGSINIHTTHIPPGASNGWMKIEVLESVSAVVAETTGSPTILCGDFNVPQMETPDGRIITWAEDIVDGEPRVRRSFRGGPGTRWDAAERTVMEGGGSRHLVDAYRHLHGYGRQESSWFVKRKERRIGRRFDHVFCSPALRVRRCEYLHSVREHGLSDHSALELDFEL